MFKTTTRTLIVAAIAATSALIACTAPSVEGTPYGTDNSASTAGNGRKNNAPSQLKETPDDDEFPVDVAGEAPASATQRPAPTTTATTAPTTAPTAAPTAAPTTPPAPPPPPNCQSTSEDACFDCCLNANPSAATIENAYDVCLNNVFDAVDLDNCTNQHASLCAGNTACKSHHACLQANRCFFTDS